MVILSQIKLKKEEHFYVELIRFNITNLRIYDLYESIFVFSYFILYNFYQIRRDGNNQRLCKNTRHYI